MSEEKDHSESEKWVNSYCGFGLRQDLAEKDIFRYADMITAHEAGQKQSDDINPAMKEWIKELEKNSEKDIYMSPRELKGYTPQVGYILDKDYGNPGKIYLNGTFTPEQLDALAQHMRKHSTDPN